MSDTGLAIFDSTLQQTNAWLGAIMDELGWDDRQHAYQALRGVLHALRDHLIVDESAQLAAQLPLLVRGIYYEGWDPSATPARERGRDAFLRRVERAFERSDADADPEQVVAAVLGTLAERVSAGEVEEVRWALPEAIRSLWPAAALSTDAQASADAASG